MKVFFDGKIFTSQKIGGISRLNFELIKGLASKKDVSQIFYHGFNMDDYPFKPEWFSRHYRLKKRFFPGWRFMNVLDSAWMNLMYWLHARPDTIFHSLYYRVPKSNKGLVVVHVYDMIQELFGGNQKTIKFKKKAFDRADLIVAISESTKRDICKLYTINPDKIIVACPGVGEVFFNQRSLSPNSQKPYMLYVGARNYVYKNFDMILNVFIDKKYFSQFDLVVFGGEKEFPGVRPTWLRQEFGDDKRLANIYANASVFIYPSRYEGFGIPPLEAMAACCPVVASNTSSVPEAVGDAALLFDPENSNDLAEKIEKIIVDKVLTAELVKRGVARARQFTWENMADRVYEGYQELLKSNNV